MRVAIAGYGNLGRGVEAAVTNAADMDLVGIFPRRDPASVTVATDTPVHAWADLASFSDKVDVVVLCGGSATDLPAQTPAPPCPAAPTTPSGAAASARAIPTRSAVSPA